MFFWVEANKSLQKNKKQMSIEEDEIISTNFGYMFLWVEANKSLVIGKYKKQINTHKKHKKRLMFRGQN